MKKIYIICFCYLLFNISNLQSQWLDALIPDFRVNDDSTTLTQGSPDIGVDGQGNFIIVWNDNRNFPNNMYGHLYCQRFNFNGTRIGLNYKIGPDSASGAKICVLKDGRFIITYIYNRNIYQQRFNNNGLPLGTWAMVNEYYLPDSIVTPNFSGDIGADSLGNYIVVWTDSRYGNLNQNVYGQRYDSTGNKLGNNFRINDILNTGIAPCIAVNKDGSFIVTFLGYVNGNGVCLQRYDKFGNSIGINQRVDDDFTNGGKGYTDITSDGKGYFVIAWDDYRINPTIAVIYYQVYDTTGNKIGINQRADVNWGPDKGATKISMQTDGKFIINWIDDRTGPDIGYCQRFNKDGSKIGLNYPIPINTGYGNSTYSILLYNLRIYSAWPDARNGNWDIYSNVRSFINPDSILVTITQNNNYVNNFKLYPGYPNPFNPSTKIRFQIPLSRGVDYQSGETGLIGRGVFVKFAVFDILGKEVTTLVNQQLQPGTYEVEWNAENYSSGIYFIKLTTESGFNATQKIILMK